jgi:hypothetical protein
MPKFSIDTEQCRRPNPYEREGKWWFYDEADSEHGPYDDRVTACVELHKYVDTYLHEKGPSMNEPRHHIVMHMNELWWQVRDQLGKYLFHKVIEGTKEFLHLAEHVHDENEKSPEHHKFICWTTSGDEPKLHVEKLHPLDAAVWYAEQHPGKYQIECVVWVEDLHGHTWSFSVRSELAYSFYCQKLSAPDGM